MLTGAYLPYDTSTPAVSQGTTLSIDFGAKVLLADADIKHPILHEVFKTSPSEGLSAIIQEKFKPDSCKKVGLGDLYCPHRGLGEKPSPLGEDFSKLAVWNITVDRAIPFTI
jgi:MinD superfamily P-loop ATPase